MNAMARLALVTVLAGLTACTPSRTSGPNPFTGGGGSGSAIEDEIQVDVQNLNFNDITIWAVRQGQRIRIGRVTGKTDETFRIDWNLALPIYFTIDVTGGRSCRTAQVAVERNARVWVAIPSNVGASPCRIGRR